MKSLRLWQRALLWAITIPAGAVILFGIALTISRYMYSDSTLAHTCTRTIRAATQNWQAVTGEHTCPTIAQLVQDKHLDPGMSGPDPWGMPYVLTCSADEIVVRCSGPDRKMGTADDIRAPRIVSEK